MSKDGFVILSTGIGLIACSYSVKVGVPCCVYTGTTALVVKDASIKGGVATNIGIKGDKWVAVFVCLTFKGITNIDTGKLTDTGSTAKA